jgi:hypothetical protein
MSEDQNRIGHSTHADGVGSTGIPLEGERKLRFLLCGAYAGAAGYYDDGEAQDCRAHPLIDFMRDSPDDIQKKMWERNRAALAASPPLALTEGKPMTDDQIEDLRGEANRGFNIERDDYFKAFRDAERAHGITESREARNPVKPAQERKPPNVRTSVSVSALGLPELPPLPEPWAIDRFFSSEERHYFIADQMREYGRQVVEACAAQPDLQWEQVEALGHRMAWRYKKSSDPHHSDTYTFNRATLEDFAEAIWKAHQSAVRALLGEDTHGS